MIHGRTNLTYGPATDPNGLDIWLDATDTASLVDSGGGAINNGDTIGQWNSKAVARSFQLFGANGRPTWDSTGFNGHAAVRTNSQILTATSSAGYASLAGITVVMAGFFVAAVAGNGCGFGITEPHETASANNSLVFVPLNGFVNCGGRRHQGDSFNSVGSSVTYATNTPIVLTAVLDYTNKRGTCYRNGVEDALNSPFQVGGSGSTAAAPDPFGISVGGFAQETGSALALPCNGYLGEILVWKSALTPDQLVPAHDYMCLRWGAGAM